MGLHWMGMAFGAGDDNKRRSNDVNAIALFQKTLDIRDSGGRVIEGV